MFLKTLSILLCTILVQSDSCQEKADEEAMAKIRFDYSQVDENGLKNGVAVEYEFCIPAEAKYVSQVKKIDPEIQVNQESKGRIRCSDAQWLCIHSTLFAEWKQKLYAYASLPYVERIQQTFYE